MKLLTVVVPCFNSEEYMRVSIDSLLIDDRVEVIIVNDGSNDKTELIALDYCAQYPKSVQLISKENGGHGSAIDAGLSKASAKYFKVLDSDDWLDDKSLVKILDYIEAGTDIDLIICNYIYEKKDALHKKTMSYQKYLPQGKPITFEDVRFPIGTYFMMHSLIHKTNVLKSITEKLPEHTFYVDNLYVFRSIANVNTMIYFDIDLYHYFIGRDDQSVNEKVMIRRIDQQIKVNKLMVDYYLSNHAQQSEAIAYMFHHLEIVTSISSIMLKIENNSASKEKHEQLWDYIKNSDMELYQSLTKRLLGQGLSKNNVLSRYVEIFVYRITQKVFGFN